LQAVAYIYIDQEHQLDCLSNSTAEQVKVAQMKEVEGLRLEAKERRQGKAETIEVY
jgi:hypothetical protein